MKYFVLVRHGRQVSIDPADDTDLSEKGIEEVRWLIEQLRPMINGLSVAIITGLMLRHKQTGQLLAEAFSGSCNSQMIEPRRILDSLSSLFLAADVVMVVGSENTIDTLRQNFVMVRLQLPKPNYKSIAWGEAAVYNLKTKEETLVRRH